MSSAPSRLKVWPRSRRPLASGPPCPGRILDGAVMARRIPRDESLARVHGVGALFSAAYGNVGSSIYYALGVTAAFALGLTPVAFVIAGLIFMATAATYAEATVMYPEAGGSASFARHAFNELVSFIAAWGQMLNYIITVAISAFFVPHYLAVFWPWLGDSPGDIIGGVAVVVFLAALNVKGTQESTRLNLILAIADLCTQVILVVIGLVLVFSPDILVDNVHLGVAPSWGDFLLGIAVGMIAYTGIETISNMSEEAKDASKTIPKGVGLTVVAVLGLYALLPLIALSAMPVHQVGGHYSTDLGTKFADDPVLGIVENLGLSAGLTNVLRYYVGVLAAVILLIATNAGLIGVSRLTFSMGHYRQLPERLRQVHPSYRTPYVAILVFSGIAIITMIPGETEAAGDPLLVRRDALLHDRPHLGDPAAPALPGQGARLEAAGKRARLRLRHPADRGVRRLRHLRGLDRRDGAQPAHPRHRSDLDGSSGSRSTCSTAARSDSLPSRPTRCCCPEPLGVEEVEYKSVLVAFEDDEPFNEQTMVTAVKLASQEAPRGARDRDRHGPESPAARRPTRASRRRRRVEDRAGQADRRPARQRPHPPGHGPTRPATRSRRRRVS